jgi:hypothetical protein
MVPSNSPAPLVRFSAPLATSPFDAVSREESQPPSTFLRSSAVCTSTSLPALFHAGATHGIQRAGAPPMNHDFSQSSKEYMRKEAQGRRDTCGSARSKKETLTDHSVATGAIHATQSSPEGAPPCRCRGRDHVEGWGSRSPVARLARAAKSASRVHARPPKRMNTRVAPAPKRSRGSRQRRSEVAGCSAAEAVLRVQGTPPKRSLERAFLFPGKPS